MSLHIVKLCVGISSTDELREIINANAVALGGRVEDMEWCITTRMVPTRADEIVGKGSLYWVIKGQIAARQPIIGIRPYTDSTGTGRCQIVLGSEVVDVQPRPRKAFQGWRYLDAADAPKDLGEGATGDVAEMPEAMRRELAEMGLL